MLKHVVTLGSPLVGAPKLLQAVLTKNILTGTVAIGNNMLYDSGLTNSVKAGLLGVGELSPTLDYFKELENGVVEGVTSGSGVQARAVYTYNDVLQRVFGGNYEEILDAQESATAGMKKMLSMDNAYFAVGYNSKTMSGATLLINVDKPADSIDSVVFYDCAYDAMGDGTVPFDSANMLQIKNPKNAAYFKLTHHALAGSDASGSEWEKEKAWLFAIINDEEIPTEASQMTPDNKPYTVIRVNAPMDVVVSSGGEELNSGDYADTTDFGTMNLMGVNDEIKMFCVDTADGYNISMDATADGVLEYAVRYYDGNGKLYDERMVTDVAITSKTEISTDVNEAEETVLEIDSDGNGTVDSTLVVNGGGSADEPDGEDHTHTYGEAKFVWADDYKSATATFTCKDNDVSQKVDAKITSKVTVEPTKTEEGQKVYTATVEFEGKTYTDTKTVPIPAGTIVAVSSLKAVNQSSSIKLTWTASKNADGYVIYRRTSDTSYKEIARISGSDTTSFVDKNVNQGVKYLYNMASYKNVDDGEEVGPKRTSATQIVRAKITSITNQNGSVKLKWTKVSGVEGYEVYRKSEGQEKYSRITTVKGSSKNYYTDKSEKAIVNGKKSQYYILPYYSESSSVVTKTAVKTNYYLKQGELSSVATNGSKKLKVKWKKNTKATGYQVRYSTDKSFDSYKTSKITSKNTLTKTLKSLKAKKTYYVKVRAYKTVSGVNYYSSWSTVKSKKTK